MLTELSPAFSSRERERKREMVCSLRWCFNSMIYTRERPRCFTMVRSLSSAFLSKNSDPTKIILFSIPSHHIITDSVGAFQILPPPASSRRTNTGPLANRNDDDTNLWNGIASLWNEIIEVSTYGPSERKMRKARRERQPFLDEMDQEPNHETHITYATQENVDLEDDQACKYAFAAVKLCETSFSRNGACLLTLTSNALGEICIVLFYP